ncbi:MAG: sodium-dependent transporter [Rhodothermales bacterium]
MAISSEDRGQWSSKLGFVMAAAGSAIGLGNIWRFPYTAGEGGGGAFVLLYLLFVALIGIPVMLAELSVGRATKRNPVGAFKALVPKSLWPAVGGLGVATGFGILAFYSVVAGWTLGYLVKAFTGGLASATSGAASGAIFAELVASPGPAILYTALFLVLTILIVRGGVSGGIERASKVLMPLLLVVLIVLAIRSITLPGGMDGLIYLFHPDFSKISFGVAMSALGQALFSLSLGMGAMITYGSYFPEKTNLWQSGIIVAFFDTMIAILAGLIIFPALFYQNMDPQGGPGLVFITLPTIFNAMPAGTLFGIAFYFLLSIAALTSTISLLEVVVSYFVDERGWTREKASWVLGFICFLLAVPSALSQGGSALLSAKSEANPGGLFAWDFLTINNNIWGNYSLSIGAILICVFVGWKWGIPKALASLEEGGYRLPASPAWSFLIRYLCPLAVLAVLIFIVVTGQYF